MKQNNNLNLPKVIFTIGLMLIFMLVADSQQEKQATVSKQKRCQISIRKKATIKLTENYMVAWSQDTASIYDLRTGKLLSQISEENKRLLSINGDKYYVLKEGILSQWDILTNTRDWASTVGNRYQSYGFKVEHSQCGKYILATSFYSSSYYTCFHVQTGEKIDSVVDRRLDDYMKVKEVFSKEDLVVLEGGQRFLILSERKCYFLEDGMYIQQLADGTRRAIVQNLPERYEQMIYYPETNRTAQASFTSEEIFTYNSPFLFFYTLDFIKKFSILTPNGELVKGDPLNVHESRLACNQDWIVYGQYNQLIFINQSTFLVSRSIEKVLTIDFGLGEINNIDICGNYVVLEMAQHYNKMKDLYIIPINYETE